VPALVPFSGIVDLGLGRDIELNDATDLRKLTSGPGRLAEAFGITRERDNEKDLTSKKSDLFIIDDGFRSHRIEVTPRIGITKAAEQPLRFIIAGNRFVSK
jgi:DNA-3-methyladenine glycosylase